VLLDYCMPGLSGAQFLRRANVPADTKVLLITAYADRQIINEMLSLGAKGYIVKPFDMWDLERHLAFHAPGTADSPTRAEPQHANLDRPVYPGHVLCHVAVAHQPEEN